MGSVAIVVIRQGMMKQGDVIVRKCIRGVGDRRKGKRYERVIKIANTECRDVEQGGVAEALCVVG